MSGHHHHIAQSSILGIDDLMRQCGPGSADGRFAGEYHTKLLQEMRVIVEHLWNAGEPDGLIKGFLLSGPPGTGKTTLAKRLALELGLCRRERFPDCKVTLAFVDSGEISRSRYGESEERIKDIFVHARSGFTAADENSVVLFDDVESIFMARGSTHAKEWHFSQNGVFFHEVDALDTRRSVLVLTTNRLDLVDEAIRDRFLAYRLDHLDANNLTAVAESLANRSNYSEADRKILTEKVHAATKEGKIRSIRDVQRFFLRDHMERIIGRKSLSHIGSHEFDEP